VLKRWFGDATLSRIYLNLAKLLGGKAAAGIISLVYLAMAARSLGPAEFGVLTLVHTYAVTVGGLLGMPAWHAVVRYGGLALRDGKRDDFVNLLRVTTLLELGAGALAVVAAALLVPVIGPRLGWSDTALAFGPLYSLALLGSVRSVPAGLLQLFNRFDLLGIHQAVPQTARLIGAVPVMLVGAGLHGFLVVWLMAGIAECVVMWAFGLSELHRRGHLAGLFGWPRGVRAAHPGLWRFVITTKLDTTLVDFSARIAPLSVGWVLGPAAAGLYNVAQRFAVVLMQPTQILGQAAYPELSRMAAAHDYRGMRRIALRSGAVALGAGLVLAAVYVLFGRKLLVLFGGPQFIAAFSLMLLVVAGRLVQIPGSPLSSGLVALGRPGQSFRVNLTANVVLFPLLVGLLYWLGLAGAGIHAMVQGVFVMGAMTLLFMRQIARHGRTPPVAEGSGP
jgi:O-antigen/teichoic acid export membrane protein